MQKQKPLMIRFSLIFVIFTLSFFTACETDFDINAEYEDMTIVYCLLSKNDTTHYVRINRAFLGDENALVMAKDPANSLYPYEDLDVTMEEWIGNDLIMVHQLDTVVLHNKEEGIFYNPTHVLYAFTAQLNQAATYRLKIRNTKLGKLIEAETNIIQDFLFERPYLPPVPPPPVVYQHPFISFIGTSPVSLEWRSAKNGYRYQPVIRYYYREINVINNDTTIQSVDWRLGSVRAPNLDGNRAMKTEINKEGFFIMLGNSIPVNNDVKRKSLYLDFIFNISGEDLNTYMEVNEPSTNLIQEKPIYTNVSNGLGLLCSRFVKDRHFDGRPLRFQLNPQTISKIINGEHTNMLGFVE